MRLRPNRRLLGVVCALGLVACDSKPAPPQPPAPPTAPPAETTQQRPAANAARATRFLLRWVEAQNSKDFRSYSALYAPDFAGTKRVGDKVSSFTRDLWLLDRKAMFERGAKVTAAQVHVLDRDGSVDLVFEQRWTTSTFADVGTKKLTLRSTGTGFLIIREDMLSSKRDDHPTKVACADLFELGDAAARHFAWLGSVERADPTSDVFAEVSSKDEADRRASDGFAWEYWSASTNAAGWLLAGVFRTSPSGDWVTYSDYCFRPDGTLAEVEDTPA